MVAYFLTVLEDGSLRPGCQYRQFLGRALFLLVDGCLLTTCSHGLSLVRMGGERELSGVSSYKDTNPVGSEPHSYILI